jgi:hypothetical protein
MSELLSPNPSLNIAIMRVVRINAMRRLERQSCTHAWIFNRKGQRRTPRPSKASRRSGTASSLLANLETRMSNFRRIICLMFKKAGFFASS